MPGKTITQRLTDTIVTVVITNELAIADPRPGLTSGNRLRPGRRAR